MHRIEISTTHTEVRLHGGFRVEIQLLAAPLRRGDEPRMFSGVALLDNAGAESCVSARVAHELGLEELYNEPVRYTTVDGRTVTSYRHGAVSLVMAGAIGVRYPSILVTGTSYDMIVGLDVLSQCPHGWDPRLGIFTLESYRSEIVLPSPRRAYC